jgi:hypothetical protein
VIWSDSSSPSIMLLQKWHTLLMEGRCPGAWLIGLTAKGVLVPCRELAPWCLPEVPSPASPSSSDRQEPVQAEQPHMTQGPLGASGMPACSKIGPKSSGGRWEIVAMRGCGEAEQMVAEV